MKLLISREHGSLIATPTFSLPEAIGGVRNCDYYYTWLPEAIHPWTRITRVFPSCKKPRTALLMVRAMSSRVLPTGDRMMRMLVYSVSALLLVGAGGVRAQNVSLKYNVDKRVAFSKFMTHNWMSIKNAESVDQSTVHQITAPVETLLAKKGLTHQSDYG